MNQMAAGNESTEVLTDSEEASRKGVSHETLDNPSSQASEMQLVPWEEPSVPVEAVPLRAIAPSKRQSTKKAREEFQLPPGWRIETRVRTAGATQGRIDKYYVPPEGGKTYRSLQDVKKALGLI